MQSVRVIRRVPSLASKWLTVPGRAVSRCNSNISEGGLGRSWADREHAAEGQYFNKKDAELLAQLANKLQNHTAPSEQSLADARQALESIFEKHSVSAPDALIDEIIKFKFNH